MARFGSTSLIRRLQRIGFSLEDAAMISTGVVPGGGGGGGEPVESVNSLFRGEWAPDELVFSTANFSPGGAIAPYVPTVTGGGTVVAIDDGIKVSPNNSTASQTAKAVLTLSDVDLEGGTLSRVTFSVERLLTGGVGGRVKRNAVVLETGGAATTTPYDLAGVVPSDVFTFETFGQFGVGDPNGSFYKVTNFKVFTAAEPYMMGEFVVHDNHMWVSEVDNNASEPGVADWVMKI